MRETAPVWLEHMTVNTTRKRFENFENRQRKTRWIEFESFTSFQHNKNQFSWSIYALDLCSNLVNSIKKSKILPKSSCLQLSSPSCCIPAPKKRAQSVDEEQIVKNEIH